MSAVPRAEDRFDIPSVLHDPVEYLEPFPSEPFVTFSMVAHASNGSPTSLRNQECAAVHFDSFDDCSAAVGLQACTPAGRTCSAPTPALAVTEAPPLVAMAPAQPSSSFEHANSVPTRRRKRGGTNKNAAPSRPWTKDEHAKFLAGLKACNVDMHKAVGRNGNLSVGLGQGVAQMITIMVGSRSAAQVRSHAQKHFQRLRRRLMFNASSSNAAPTLDAESPDLFSRAESGESTLAQF